MISRVETYLTQDDVQARRVYFLQHQKKHVYFSNHNHNLQPTVFGIRDFDMQLVRSESTILVRIKTIVRPTLFSDTFPSCTKFKNQSSDQ